MLLVPFLSCCRKPWYIKHFLSFFLSCLSLSRKRQCQWCSSMPYTHSDFIACTCSSVAPWGSIPPEYWNCWILSLVCITVGYFVSCRCKIVAFLKSQLCWCLEAGWKPQPNIYSSCSNVLLHRAIEGMSVSSQQQEQTSNRLLNLCYSYWGC